MRVTPFTFSGYPSGNVDFAARYAAADDDTQSAFDTMLRNVGRAIFADAISQPYVAITVIGHSDRQDTPGMTHQQAHASEAAASKARAEDAWAWMRQRISEQAGPAAEGWEENSPKVTWAWVSAGAGQMAHPQPISEQDRMENRRVVILFSHFELLA